MPEFAPTFFGELYPSLQALKAAFDPYNQLNPGKIATPSGSGHQLTRVDEVQLRGDADGQIDPQVWQSYSSALKCNGNGACYNFDPDDAMCPSWKATRERMHSPKGRASLFREWLRLQGEAGVDVIQSERSTPSFLRSLPVRWRNTRGPRNGVDDFSHEVYDAMAGCLACKSCAGQCPVQVSVPEFRSRFLALYHARYLRPIRNYLIGSLEYTIPHLAHAPGLYNTLMSAPPVQRWLEKNAGMVDSPLLSRFAWTRFARHWNVQTASVRRLSALTSAQRVRSVVFVQDAFTRYFESPVAASFMELASRLGFRVYLAPFLPNGKPLQVQGFLSAFDKAARENAAQLRRISESGVALVGLDPAMTLVYRQEYRKLLGIDQSPNVLLPQEWLLNVFPESRCTAPVRQYVLLPHCTEKTNASSSSSDWTQLFQRANLELSTPAAGCCGMSGTYGHEARNVRTSRAIFEQSWARIVDTHEQAELLATGYSCRGQVSRLREKRLRHPVEALLECIRR